MTAAALAAKRRRRRRGLLPSPARCLPLCCRLAATGCPLAAAATRPRRQPSTPSSWGVGCRRHWLVVTPSPSHRLVAPPLSPAVPAHTPPALPLSVRCWEERRTGQPTEAAAAATAAGWRPAGGVQRGGGQPAVAAATTAAKRPSAGGSSGRGSWMTIGWRQRPRRGGRAASREAAPSRRRRQEWPGARVQPAAAAHARWRWPGRGRRPAGGGGTGVPAAASQGAAASWRRPT